MVCNSPRLYPDKPFQRQQMDYVIMPTGASFPQAPKAGPHVHSYRSSLYAASGQPGDGRFRWFFFPANQNHWVEPGSSDVLDTPLQAHLPDPYLPEPITKPTTPLDIFPCQN
jgi:hypothetical protein